MRKLWYIALLILILPGFSCEEEESIRLSINNSTPYALTLKIKFSHSPASDTIIIPSGKSFELDEIPTRQADASHPFSGIDSMRFLPTGNMFVTADPMIEKNWALVSNDNSFSGLYHENRLVFEVQASEIWTIRKK
ncbi:MAG: hypothetical protein ACLFM1_06725 [Bacteroidales bacterium]